MPKYPSWPTTDQGNIVGTRIANEMYHRFTGGLNVLSLTDQKDAALTELLATTSEAFNVTSFGAKGDKVADDTAAIQMALDTKGAVFFPKPSVAYRTTAALRFYSGQKIFGDGPENTVIEAQHANNILEPNDFTASYKATEIHGLQLTKDATNTGTGAGLRISNHRAGLFSHLRITNCNIGLHFEPQENANFSYFNTFADLEISSCTTNAILLDATGTDFPNTNYFVRGDWRGGTTTLLVSAGSGQEFSNISIQGATVNWAQIDTTGVVFVAPRFENSTPLAPNTGLVFSTTGGQVIGGSSSKGQIVPFKSTSGTVDTNIVAHLNNGTLMDIGARSLDDYFVSTRQRTSPWGGLGSPQNLLARASLVSAAAWTKSGTVTVTPSQADPRGGTSAQKIAFGTGAGTTPVYRQASSTAAASQTCVFGVWIRGDTVGRIRFRVNGDTGATPETLTVNVFVTTDWRLMWIKQVFTAAATGDIEVSVANSNNDENLDTIYIFKHFLQIQDHPGAPTETTSVIDTDTVIRFIGEDIILDGSDEGVATKVISGTVDDTDFANAIPGLIGIDQNNNRLYVRYVDGSWHYATLTA